MKMAICGCGSENEFYKVSDDIELVLEKYNDCPDCGAQNIQVHILKDKDKECFCEYGDVEEKRLAYWMGKDDDRQSIIIGLQDFEDSLKRKIEETFDALWGDVLTEEEMEKLPDELLEKIESEFQRVIMVKIKEED